MKIDSEESLDIAVEDRSLKVIFLQNSGYYVMRGQDSYINQKLIGHRMRYPRMTIVLDIV